MELLQRLCLTPGIAGRESRVRELISQVGKPLFDEIRTDPMGSLIGIRRPRRNGKKAAGAAKTSGGRSSGGRDSGGALKVMLAAHMDQIGFIVRHVESNGFLRIMAVGGFDTRNLFARIVSVCTDEGDLPGVLNPGGRPIHIATDEDKKKIPEVQDFVVDLGLGADEVKKRVKIGDMVVLQAPFAEIGDTVVSQALDNRVACWIVAPLGQIKQHDCEIHCVFTVQEEVGLRGAMTAAYGVKPDVGIGVDVTLAVDTPGVSEDQRVSMLGGGAAITLMDGSFIADTGLVSQFETVAKRKRIKYQRSVLPRGGTDTGAVQRAAAGCRAITLSCPTRYIHSVTEMVHKQDLFACRDLLTAYLAEARQRRKPSCTQRL